MALGAVAVSPVIASAPHRVLDINPSGDSNPSNLTAVGNTLYFTAGAMTRVRDIYPGASSGEPSWLTAMGGSLYFCANDSVHGAELWKSNGTTAGTVGLTDINPSGDSSPSYLTGISGTLFFTATDGASGVELWKRAS
jgi:ELWxxDGT repeat protein